MKQREESNETRQKGSLLWFVVQTKPGNEERVKTNLLNQEIESYLPMLKVLQYSGGKMVPRVRPLFPNYLFAKLDVDIHYYKVKWTRGVNKILGGRNGPIPISERVVETIRERAGRDNLIELQDEMKDGDHHPGDLRAAERPGRSLPEGDVEQGKGEGASEPDRRRCSCPDIALADQEGLRCRLSSW